VILQQIVAALTAERNLLDRAISALNGISTQPRRGRPPKAVQKAARPKRRRLSAAARRKLSRLLKQRWAQGKMKRAKVSKPVRRMSGAARKKIAAAQRARWAKAKAQ
jgi:hypothetical protein